MVVRVSVRVSVGQLRRAAQTRVTREGSIGDAPMSRYRRPLKYTGTPKVEFSAHFL